LGLGRPLCGAQRHSLPGPAGATVTNDHGYVADDRRHANCYLWRGVSLLAERRWRVRGSKPDVEVVDVVRRHDRA
jgi:hypothetical protein